MFNRRLRKSPPIVQRQKVAYWDDENYYKISSCPFCLETVSLWQGNINEEPENVCSHFLQFVSDSGYSLIAYFEGSADLLDEESE